MKRNPFFFLLLLCSLSVVYSCTDSTSNTARPKYVFLFIGDGMGLAHVTATENYLAAHDGRHGSDNVSFTQFPVTGLVTTWSANSLVTCSSAAATAFSTGEKTNNNMMCFAPDSVRKLQSITWPLHRAGYKIGVTTSVSIDHATPGAFYAYALARDDYYEIASQAAATGFDFFAGSGFIYPKGKQEDQPDVYEQLQAAGYRIVRGPEGAAQVAGDNGEKTVLVQVEGKDRRSLPYAIDRHDDDLTLSQITQATIRALENPKGFFTLIEGGKIDWAAHDNDGATMIHEIIDLSEAVRWAVAFYQQHPDETLIIVTADHETGGLSIGRDGIYAFRPTAYDERSYSLDVAKSDEEKNALKETDKKANAAWTTGGHTGIMVPLYALGAGSEQFSGKLDNTDIPKRILQVMGVKAETK